MATKEGEWMVSIYATSSRCTAKMCASWRSVSSLAWGEMQEQE